MPSEINVPPVTGMTPAQVATELRVLIRDQIWRGIRQLGEPPGAKDMEPRYRAITEETNDLIARLDSLDSIVTEIQAVSKNRRPSEIRQHARRAQAVVIRARVGIAAIRSHQKYIAANASQPSVDTKTLAHQAERAYALVQSLPTIENPAIGRAENTLRAITSILKVYHGVDVEGAPEKLPNVMAALMEQLAEAKKPKPELWVPATSNDPAPSEPKGPFRIVSYVSGVPGKAWSVLVVLKATFDSGYAPAALKLSVMPDLTVWQNGNCSFADALLVFRACRSRFATPSIALLDGDGEEIIVASRKTFEWGIPSPPDLVTGQTPQNTAEHVNVVTGQAPQNTAEHVNETEDDYEETSVNF